MTSCSSLLRSLAVAVALSASAVVNAPFAAATEALLLVEADTGKVLIAENATQPWYPASVTKLMTLYVTLRAVKERRITFDKMLTVSANAASQAPSKMGFRPGTQLTVDNALKMVMVKSANDMAVVVAEGVGGSVEGFATEMNRSAARLGMTQTTYVNPNGLPADNQITSARDLAILARALIREFPEYELYWRIPAIKFGRKVIHTTNRVLTTYEGADGMKTGFICASGFNMVATATRNGRKLIAVVMGSPSGAYRNQKAAMLLEKGFEQRSNALSWLTPSLGSVDSLVPIAAAPPNLREDTCGKHRRRPAAEEAEETVSSDAGTALANLLPTFRMQASAPRAALLQARAPSMAPVPVFIGPPKKTQLASDPATKRAALIAPKPAATQNAALGTAILPAQGFVQGRPMAYTSAPEQGADGGASAGSDVPMPRPRPKPVKRVKR